MRTIGLVGARGHVGRELVRLIEQDPDLRLGLATSRELRGRRANEVFTGSSSDLVIEALTPEEVATRPCDAYVLGLPNGLAAPFVAAIEAERPESRILDLSADHRAAAFAGEAGWTYGLPELGRSAIRQSRRIANPGCYATAAILCLWPIRDRLAGTPSAFGISGCSGAGTTPGPRNDPDRLRDNVVPYGFGGHGHRGEIAKAIGRPVVFVPHVASFFRGLIVTVTAPLQPGVTIQEVTSLIEDAYADSEVVTLQGDPPEPARVASTTAAIIGGAAIDPDTGVLTVACALDNLLKGAASQAVENLRLSFGLA